MQTRLIICNRAAAAPVDGWIHIVPKGDLPNAEAGLVQVLDDTSLDSILANIQKDKNRLGANWPGVYAGREHFIYDSGQDSAALGWFKEFEKRPTGLWARDDGLTPLGADAVKNRLYKYTSFVADPADLEHVAAPGESATDSAPPRYRVMKIETIGFTNHANGKELLTPIANRLTTPVAVAQTFQSAGSRDFLVPCSGFVEGELATGKSPEPADWKVCATQNSFAGASTPATALK